MFGFKKATVLAALSLFLSAVNARPEALKGLRNPGLRIHKQFACSLALQLSNFDVFNTNEFPKWFNDDSVLQLYNTGSYYGNGIDGIQEYVNFFDSKDFIAYEALSDPVLFYNQITSDSETCKVTYAIKRKFELAEDLYTANACWTITGGATTYFDIDDDDSFVNINRINLYAPPTFSPVSEAQPEEFPPRLCGIMQEHCPSEWEENAYTDLDDCEQKLGQVSTADGVYFDGDTLTCRWVHSTFMSTYFRNGDPRR